MAGGRWGAEGPRRGYGVGLRGKEMLILEDGLDLRGGLKLEESTAYKDFGLVIQRRKIDFRNSVSDVSIRLRKN